MNRANVLLGHLAPALASPLAASHAAGVAGGKLRDHVAIITGSGNGIGEAAAKKFAAEGCAVVVSDLDPVKSDKVAADICAAGGKAISVPGDVTDAKWPELVVKKTIEAFGKLHFIGTRACEKHFPFSVWARAGQCLALVFPP